MSPMSPVAIRVPLLVLAVGSLLPGSKAPALQEPSVPVRFLNVSEQAGTAIPHVWGSKDNQRYII